MTLHTTYFGPVSWYAAIIQSPDGVVIDDAENYVKQTVRNHCRIATANGVQKLTVPVTLNHDGKTPIRDVRISDHGNWRHLHWQALSSAYGMSPFFDYYADDIRPFFEKKWDYLYDYNNEIMQKVMEMIGQPSVGIAKGAGKEKAHTYYQTFQRRHGFLPDMSILDLLFNMGPEAILYLNGY